MARRHEVLRTTFRARAGEPVQVIAKAGPVSLDITELSPALGDLTAATIEAALAEYRKPFRLAEGPLIRAHLWRLGEKDHVLLVTLHHIVSDAWTAGILFDELAVLYEAFHEGKPSPLSELPIQYADYAVWQREHLNRERLQTEVAHWENHLAGAPPLLKLPTDHPRPAAPTGAGSLATVALPAALVETAVELGRLVGATPFMTLLAAFSILVSRYAASSDVVVGTDLANRTQLETEKLIGFFINLLPVRLRPVETLTFRELLAQVKEAALDVYARQDFPFDKLVEALQPDRAVPYHPIVQVLFVMLNIRRALPRLADLVVTEFELPIVASKFDLAVFMEEKAGTIVGYWLYSTELFEEATILRMARHFETLLRAAVESPDARLSSLAMLSEDEKAGAERESRIGRLSKTQKLKMTKPEAVRLNPAHEGN